MNVGIFIFGQQFEVSPKRVGDFDFGYVTFAKKRAIPLIASWRETLKSSTRSSLPETVSPDGKVTLRSWHFGQ